MQLELQADKEEFLYRFLRLSSPHDLADLLEIGYDQLVFQLYVIPDSKKYTIFSLQKKTGGVRTINAPITSLKIIQQKLNQILQNVYDVKAPVHGFVPQKSIVTNAKIHTGQKYVFNVDLKNFFPSIHFGRVWGLFIAPPYELPESVATVLAQICCINNQLPQGAPTSPIISNMICAKMDNHLEGLARFHKCRYTRYADDLTFSTSQHEFPDAIARVTKQGKANVGEKLLDIIDENGFQINENKVRLQTRKYRQSVTGLTVNVRTNVSQKHIRQIRAMLHAWQKYGLDAAEIEFCHFYDKKHRAPFKEPPSFKKVVKGKIEFLGMVRGKDDPIYQRFLKKYSTLDPDFDYCLDERNPDMIETKSQTQIFLCHASEDKDKVQEIYRKLKRAGYKPWLDKEDILPGQDWDRQIRKAIKASAFILIFFSKTSVSKRGYVQKEFVLVREVLDEIPEGQIFVIPVRLEKCDIPDRFVHLHYCDLFEDDGFEKVLKSIDEELLRSMTR